MVHCADVIFLLAVGLISTSTENIQSWTGSSDLQGYALTLQPAVLHATGRHLSHTSTCCQTGSGRKRSGGEGRQSVYECIWFSNTRWVCIIWKVWKNNANITLLTSMLSIVYLTVVPHAKMCNDDIINATTRDGNVKMPKCHYIQHQPTDISVKVFYLIEEDFMFVFTIGAGAKSWTSGEHGPSRPWGLGLPPCASFCNQPPTPFSSLSMWSQFVVAGVCLKVQILLRKFSFCWRILEQLQTG